MAGRAGETAVILTRAQVTELSGYRKPSCQIKWLKRQGLRFFVGADGYPRVPTSEIERKPAVKATEPDFEALGRLR